MISGLNLNDSLLLLAAKSACWLGAMWLIGWLLRRRSAALRSGWWSLVLVGLLLLPSLQTVLPTWGPQLVPGAAPAARVTAVSPVGEASVAVPAPAQERRPDPTAPAAVLAPFGHTSPAADRRTWVLPPAMSALPGLLGALWGLGTFVFLGRLWASHAAARRLLRGAVADTHRQRATLLEDGRQHLGVHRSVRVVMSDHSPVPMTFGCLRPVVLLPANATAWPVDRLRHVLLHELAHVHRHDWALQLVGNLACAVFWFNPLAWAAARAQGETAEQASDDLAVASTPSPPSAYAQDLLAIARALRDAVAPRAGLVAMARSSELAERIDAVLDTQRPRNAPASPWLITTGLSVLLLAGLMGSLAPTRAPAATAADAVEPPVPASEPVPVPTPAPVPSAALEPPPATVTSAVIDHAHAGQLHVSVHEYHGNRSVHWSMDDREVRVEARGEVIFADDDSAIASIAADGLFSLEERRGSTVRLLLATHDGAGAVAHDYRVDGLPHPWDDEARRWLRESLLDLFRTTGFDADARVARIVARAGVPAVFAELDQVLAGQAVAAYLMAVLEQVPLSEEQLSKSLAYAAARVRSDRARTHYLRAVLARYRLDDALQLDYVAALDGVSSDRALGEALVALLDQMDGVLSARVLQALLRATDTLESDRQIVHVLGAVLRGGLPTGKTLDAFTEAAGSIRSDRQTAELARAVLNSASPPAPAHGLLALQLLATVASDATVASAAADIASTRQALTDVEWQALLAVIEDVQSHSARGRLITAVLGQGALDPARLRSLLHLIEQITSDGVQSRVLVAMAHQQSLDETVRTHYLRVVDGLRSTSSKERARRAVGAL